MSTPAQPAPDNYELPKEAKYSDFISYNMTDQDREAWHADQALEHELGEPLTDAQILWDQRNQISDQIARALHEQDRLTYPDAYAAVTPYVDVMTDDQVRDFPWHDRGIDQAVDSVRGLAAATHSPWSPPPPAAATATQNPPATAAAAGWGTPSGSDQAHEQSIRLLAATFGTQPGTRPAPTADTSPPAHLRPGRAQGLGRDGGLGR